MKKAVFLNAIFFLMCTFVCIGGQAYATEGDMPLYAQNIYDDQGREYEEGAYPGYEGHYDQEESELPPADEGDGQYYDEQPEPLEPPSYQEGEGEYNQEPSPYPEDGDQYPQELPEELEPPLPPEGDSQDYEEPPQLPPLPEDGQDEQLPQPSLDDGGEQYPNLPEPTLPEPGLEREPLDKDENGLQKEIDRQMENMPALPDTPQAAGGLPAFDDPALELASGQCANSGGRVTILVDDNGVGSGTSYVKSGKPVAFLHGGTVGQDVTITPAGFFNTNGFRITPKSKIIAIAKKTTKPIHGLVKVNAGKSNETAHDVIICP